MTEGVRVRDGDRFEIFTHSYRADQVRARIILELDAGGFVQHEFFHTPNTNGNQASTAGSRIGGAGTVVQVFVALVDGASGVKRGQNFAQFVVVDRNDNVQYRLARGYLYDAGSLTLGTDDESTSGKGYLDWVQEANDAAGSATTTVNLAASNVRRLVRAVIVKIHSSGDSATRTWTMTLRDLADSGGPTNWSIASDTWVSPTLTLTANEEGLLHLGEHGFVSTNDAGTLAYADNSSAPNPFPLEVEEGDTVDLIIAAGSGHANDDYDVWVQYEEWIAP